MIKGEESDIFLMKLCFLAENDYDKKIFFSMLRTNLDHNFGMSDYKTDYQSTIGVNICVKHLFDESKGYNNDQIAKLIIWDSSTDDIFKWVRPFFYNGSVGSIILHSGNNVDDIEKTKQLICEFDKYDFPKYLVILIDSNLLDNPSPENFHIYEKYQENISNLEQYAISKSFNIRFFEKEKLYNEHVPESYEEFSGYWRELRNFYEMLIIDIFSHAVKNNYDVENFKKYYFTLIDKFDKSLRNIYHYIDEIGLEHDKRNIYVRIKEGLFKINIFTSACFYQYEDKTRSKYVCMVPKDNQFYGWSNLTYLPRNFLLSVAKAFYLMHEQPYDTVMRKQLANLNK